MRKQSIFVHGYQRRPFHMYGSYVEEPKRTIEHFREILKDTEKDITDGLEAEKKSRKQLEDELKLAKRNAQAELEKAIEDNNKARIKYYKDQQDVFEAQTRKLQAETAAAKQLNDLRTELARRQAPIADRLAKLKSIQEIEKVRDEIASKRIETKQQMAALTQTRANTVIALRNARRADTEGELKAAKTRLDMAQQSAVRFPASKSLAELSGTAQAREAQSAVVSWAKEKMEEPRWETFEDEDLLKLVLAGRITVKKYTEIINKRTKEESKAMQPSKKKTRKKEAGGILAQLIPAKKGKQEGFSYQGKFVSKEKADQIAAATGVALIPKPTPKSWEKEAARDTAKYKKEHKAEELQKAAKKLEYERKQLEAERRRAETYVEMMKRPSKLMPGTLFTESEDKILKEMDNKAARAAFARKRDQREEARKKDEKK